MARPRLLKVRGGRSFEYVSQGRGPATLVVHPGGPGFTYHYLRSLLALANAHQRVVLFNPRGVGRSWKPKRSSGYTVANQAEDLEAIRRALDIEELHLLGFSAGGFAALEYAHRYEKNLVSLILCGTAGSGEEIAQATRMMRGKASDAQRRRLRELERSRKFDTVEYRELCEAVEQPFQTRFLSERPKDLLATRFFQPVYRAMMTRTGDESKLDGSVARWDGRRYYAHIEVPTLVLVGRYDFLLEPSREMADRIVPAHLRVLPHASHMAMLEQPREFLGAIREFLLDVTGD